jgi:hypothetical protein
MYGRVIVNFHYVGRKVTKPSLKLRLFREMCGYTYPSPLMGEVEERVNQ